MEILGVSKGSVAEELNIVKGDKLVAFDGNIVEDILDYEYYLALEQFTMTIETADGITDFLIEKYDDEDLGLVLQREMDVKSCKNNCIFCFINQLPCGENLRSTLRVKDDDYRHSFISGNYVTLTNVKQADLARIIRLKLSPLYVSVHSTDLQLRNKLLGIKHAPDIVEQLTKLKNAGIEVHAQIVYCPGINEDYASTADILSGLTKSLAIVPVGLTKDCNPILKPVTKQQAARLVDVVTRLSQQMLIKTGSRFVFAADEFYLKAEAKIPDYDCYEDFNQIENGIGLLAMFDYDFNYALSEVKYSRQAKKQLIIVTGISAYKFIKQKADILTQKFGVDICVCPVINNFFGNSVTVAGLVVGRDIVHSLTDGGFINTQIEQEVIIPKVMLKEFNDIFLDNMTVRELSDKLHVDVRVIASDGDGFVRGILNDIIVQQN